jgi:hypothetical protein
MELTPFEERFIQIYGDKIFQTIRQSIVDDNIMEFYLKVRDPKDLFDFGFHYGIPEIVAFCYCVLKCPIDIDREIQSYYKMIESSPEIVEMIGNRQLSLNSVPVSSSGGRAGITVGSIDTFTKKRIRCIKYIIKIRKFSRYTVEKGRFIYRIVDRYVDSYRLLEVN